MRRLLSLGLDIFARDDEGHTPLIVAVQENSISCVTLALEAAGGQNFTRRKFLLCFLFVVFNFNFHWNFQGFFSFFHFCAEVFIVLLVRCAREFRLASWFVNEAGDCLFSLFCDVKRCLFASL